jgi:hypothetical protein
MIASDIFIAVKTSDVCVVKLRFIKKNACVVDRSVYSRVFLLLMRTLQRLFLYAKLETCLHHQGRHYNFFQGGGAARKFACNLV